MKYLVTYICERSGHPSKYGYLIEDSLVDFVNRTQFPYCDERYFIVNSIEITDQQASEWEGNLKGM